jgi:hypothetical protein
MSCNCSSGSSYDGGIYEGVCNADIPYPSVSHESVPSLIDNLVYALYGVIEKDVTSGKVVWNIPCDPSNIQATINNIPRNDGEGLLCYIIRALNLTTPSGFVTVNGVQTLTNKTLTAPVINTATINTATINNLTATGSLVLPAGSITSAMIANGAIVPADLSTGGPNWDAGGNLTATSFVGPLSGNATTATTATNIASGVAGAVPYQTAPSTTGFTAAGTSGQVLLSNGTSAPTWSTNIAGNAGTATQLQTSRTLGISGDVTGTASFDGSANATISGTIANGVVTAAKLGTNEQKQICKAWVNFNGTTATPSTIRSSYNVSSITKNGTGDYTVNFATALADANYSAVVMAQGATTSSLVAPVAYAGTATGGAQFVTPSAASVRFSTWTSSLSGQADSAIINVQIFGN